jgi:hypothetical protein
MTLGVDALFKCFQILTFSLGIIIMAMGGMNVRKIMTVLMLILLALPLGALADGYSIPMYSMDVAIQADGSAQVTEDLTYNFDGNYNGILSAIDVGDVEGLEDLRLYVDGGTQLRQVDVMNKDLFTYTAVREGDLIKIQAYAPGDGGQRSFRYTYTMLGLAQRYQDAARLNYKLIGIANDVTLGGATVRVTFPAAPEHWFAHGAMGAEDLSIDSDGALVAGPKDVEPGQYMEIDALFPADSMGLAPLIDQPIVQATLDTEARLAEEKAAAEAAAAETRNRMRYGVMGLLAAFFIAAAVLLRQKLARYGIKKDVKPTDDMQALDGLDAAVAEQLVRGKASESGFSATLLELVQKGALAMASEVHPLTGEKQTKFTVVNRNADKTQQQEALFDWLFANREFLWIEDLSAGNDAKLAQSFASGYSGWQRAVKQQAVDQGLYFGNGVKMGCGVAMLSVGGVLISVALFFLGQIWLGLAGLFLTGVIAIGFSRVRSITDQGEEKFAAVRGFCEKYGEKLSNLPAEALKYLPVLVGLGYVEPLAQYLDQRANQPEYGYGGGLPLWWYAGWYFDMGRVGRSFHDVQRHNAGVVAKSSGSSGGGFSGSSGGGGGGGGHGAW